MREKYIIRERDNMGHPSEVVLGLRYSPPSEKNDWLGQVLAGGPKKFERDAIKLLRLVREICQQHHDSGKVIKVVGGSANKRRWQITGVSVRAWNDALTTISKGFEVRQVRSFRRLMG